MEGGSIMLKQTIEDALNKQINEEMFSSYLYLSMASYFESINLLGFANWMHVQAKEEMTHAMKFYAYVNERGGRVKLAQIDAPKTDWANSLEVMDEVLAHEQKITESINNLVNLAIDEKDHASNIFLQWFVTEQVEEEASVSDVLNKLKLMENAPGGLFMLDRELSARVFVPPVENA